MPTAQYWRVRVWGPAVSYSSVLPICTLTDNSNSSNCWVPEPIMGDRDEKSGLLGSELREQKNLPSPLSAFQIKKYVQSNRIRAFKILLQIPIIRTKHFQILHIHVLAYLLFSSSSPLCSINPEAFLLFLQSNTFLLISTLWRKYSLYRLLAHIPSISLHHINMTIPIYVLEFIQNLNSTCHHQYSPRSTTIHFQ